MSDPHWADLAAAYVLETLDEHERVAFEERLATDTALQEEVRVQWELVAALADAVPRRTPPSALRARVLSEASSIRPIGSAPSDGSGARGNVRGGSSARGHRGARAPWLAAAAALVVAVGLGVVAQRLEERRAALQDRLVAIQAALDQARAEVVERDSLLATFMGPSVRSATLAATGQPPSARVFWNTETSNLLVTVFDLPPAPTGRVYQLWGIAGDDPPVSLGTFQTSADGRAVLQRAAPPGAAFDLGAVTEEPAGGSPQPTSTPFLLGSWTQD